MSSGRDEDGERDDLNPGSSDAAVRRTLVEARQEFLAFLQKRMDSREAAEEILQRFSLRALENAAELRDVRAGLARPDPCQHHRRPPAPRHQATAAGGRGGTGGYGACGKRTGSLNRWDGVNCLYKLLPTLKPEYADLIWRADILGEPRDRIAATLGTTLNNVTVRLHRGRQALKKRLEEMCLTCPVHGFLDCRCPRPSLSAGSGQRSQHDEAVTGPCKAVLRAVWATGDRRRKRAVERVAIITGGRRGIGAAIERCLKVSGYTAAAIYHGNAAAEAFGSKPQSPSASVTLPRRGNTLHRRRPIRTGG